MKRLDCSGSSALHRDTFRVGLCALTTGPSLLRPSFRMLTLHHAVLFSQAHRQFTAIRAGVSRLFAQSSLKLRNTIFQGGDAFAVSKDLTDIFSEKAESFGHPTDINGSAHHGSANCSV